jgi:type IV pilus assembly protein PilA
MHSKAMYRGVTGFTLIELMVVIAIIGILSTLAVPSFLDRVVRTQVGEGIALSEFARASVQAYYTRHRRMPANNAAAGLPPADRIIGNTVSGVAVVDGVLEVSFGNRANRYLAGRTLALRPAVVDEYPVVPIAWVCGNASVPAKMRVLGANRTDVPNPQLPVDCRP